MVKLLHASPTMVLLATLQLKPLLSCQEGAAARGSSSVLASFWAHLKLQSAPTMVRPQFVRETGTTQPFEMAQAHLAVGTFTH